MDVNVKNDRLSKYLTILFSIICIYFYLNVCLGYFICKLFYNFINNINDTNPYRIIQFRKKFSLKNIGKFVINYIKFFFKNWCNRIIKKWFLVLREIGQVINALKSCKKKLKPISRLSYNLRLLKNLLLILCEFFQIVTSFINEVLFYS
jgi:hypothetical protein